MDSPLSRLWEHSAQFLPGAPWAEKVIFLKENRKKQFEKINSNREIIKDWEEITDLKIQMDHKHMKNILSQIQK